MELLRGILSPKPRILVKEILAAVGILVFLGLSGCARPTASPPTAPLLPAQVPVRVTTSPAKPERPATANWENPPEAAQAGDECRLEGFSQALRKIKTRPRASKPGEKIYPVDINLKNADLVEAVRVLADTLGLNYSIDPRVKGTVNVRASGKLTQSELLSILETLLSVNNATLVKVDKLYKIVPMEKAATGAAPVYSRGATPPGMRVQVVFLEQTQAGEMMSVLKPLMSPAGNISEAANNSLVLVDEPNNLDKLLDLISLIDSQAMARTMVRLFKVNNSDPKEIIKEMETIFSAYGTLSPKGKFGVSFLPVSRLNSVLVLANSAPLMERARYWVCQLDQRTDMLANVHVYHVENYKARNLANLLNQVYGGQASQPTVKEVKPTTTPSPMGSSLLQTTSTPGGGSGAGGASRPTGMTLGGGSETQSSLAGGGMPGEAAPAGPTLKERATPGGTAEGVSPKEGVRIIPDEENNLLVVVAPPHEWNIIAGILRRLDIMPRQVLNEVLVAEVRLTEELKYGIEFVLGGKPGTTSIDATTGATTTNSTGAPTTIQGVTVTSPTGATFTAAGGLTFVAIDTYNKLRGLINLLAAQGKVDILASPHIMAANNQEARIQIGEDVPIKTSESVPLISQATSFQTSTVQYRSTGIILIVKPQINAKGQVTLEIAQEVSSALPLSVGETSPRISVRQARTSLITGDNQTVVLGGLIREDRSNTSAGIPGIRKLPLVGPFFGSEGRTRAKTELLVLITPHVVNNLEEGQKVTRDMKEKMGLEEKLSPFQRPGRPSGP
jgi:general secretion pathway protein D